MKWYEGAIAILTIGLILMTIRTIHEREAAMGDRPAVAAITEFL